MFFGWCRRENCIMREVFPPFFGVDTCINSNNIRTIPYHFISTRLNIDVTVANDVVIDFAKCSLPGKVMQWSPCLEVRTLTNENGRYMIKLNDIGTRQIIRYRATVTLRRLQKSNMQPQNRGGGYKTNRNIIKFWQSMKRCTRRPFRKIIPHQGC